MANYSFAYDCDHERDDDSINRNENMTQAQNQPVSSFIRFTESRFRGNLAKTTIVTLVSCQGNVPIDPICVFFPS